MILLFIGKAPSRIARAYEYGGLGDVIGTRLAERPAALLSSCRLCVEGRSLDPGPPSAVQAAPGFRLAPSDHTLCSALEEAEEEAASSLGCLLSSVWK